VNTEGFTTQERQLSEMLHRVTPEPSHQVSVEDIAFRLANEAAAGGGRLKPRARGSRSHRPSWNRGWAPVLAAVSVFLVAAASAGAVAGLSSHHSPSGTGSSIGATPTSHPASSSSSAPSNTPTSNGPTFPPEHVAGGIWDAELLDHQTLNEESLTGGADSLYATEQGSLDRIDPVTGNVVAEVSYNAPIAGPPVVAGNTVWVVWSYTAGSVVLHGYDARTLSQIASVTVPASGQLSTSAQGVLTLGSDGNLYLAAGGHVAVVSPSSHRVVREVTVSGGLASSVAVSPDGSRLYVSTFTTTSQTLGLRTYDLATGTRLSASSAAIGGGGNLVATSGGVWGTAGVGMTERVWFAPDGDLSRIVLVGQGASGGLAAVPTLSGGTLWIGGSHTLECADPATGKVLAQTIIPTDGGVVEDYGSVAVTSGHVYAYYQNVRGQQSGVAVLTPPSACSS